MSPLKWEDGTPRSRGGPFEVLYRPRAPMAISQPPKKRGPKARNHIAKTLAALRDPDAGNKFNTPIMTRAESDRTLAIQGAPC